jgi:predicted P-loop ATPase
LQLHNAWINELAELDRFLSKRDASDLKKALSIRSDKFRLPYGKGVEEFPRKFVVCGTTNKDEFWVDPTGNRRYWVIPIQVTKIDIAWLREHRDEIWAAAVELYNQKHNCFLNEEEKIRHAQLMRTYEVTDTWEDYIQPYLLQRSEVIISDILQNRLGIEPGQQKKTHQMRVADILKRLGWVRVEKRGNRSKKVWVKNSEVIPEVGTGRDEVGTEVGTAKTLIPQDVEEGVPTLVKNSDKTFSTNVVDSKKKSNLPNENEKKSVANRG